MFFWDTVYIGGVGTWKNELKFVLVSKICSQLSLNTVILPTPLLSTATLHESLKDAGTLTRPGKSEAEAENFGLEAMLASKT